MRITPLCFIALIAALCIGCDIYFVSGIPPEHATYEPKLVGNWREVRAERDSERVFTVIAKDTSGRYVLKLPGQPDSQFELFRIDENYYLQSSGIESNGRYAGTRLHALYRVDISSGNVKAWSMSSEFFRKNPNALSVKTHQDGESPLATTQFTVDATARQLVSFLKLHSHDEHLWGEYSECVVFERLADPSAPPQQSHVWLVVGLVTGIALVGIGLMAGTAFLAFRLGKRGSPSSTSVSNCQDA